MVRVCIRSLLEWLLGETFLGEAKRPPRRALRVWAVQGVDQIIGLQRRLLGPVAGILARTRSLSTGVLASQERRHASLPCDTFPNSGCPLFTPIHGDVTQVIQRVRHPGRRTRLHRAEASAPANALRRRVIVHRRRLAAVLRGGVRAGANALNRRDFGYSAPTTLRKVIARTIW